MRPQIFLQFYHWIWTSPSNQFIKHLIWFCYMFKCSLKCEFRKKAPPMDSTRAPPLSQLSCQWHSLFLCPHVSASPFCLAFPVQMNNMRENSKCQRGLMQYWEQPVEHISLVLQQFPRASPPSSATTCGNQIVPFLCLSLSRAVLSAIMVLMAFR